MEIIKTIKDKDYTNTARTTYQVLKDRYGYTLRISRILEVIKDVFLSSSEFLLIDLKTSENGQFDSYMIDRLIDWQQDKEVNFSKIKEEIFKTYQFSTSERLTLDSGNLEERLWGFFLALSKPSLEE